MVKRKVCKSCKMFVEGNECPCGSTSFTNSFQGRLIITDAERSQIAKNINISRKGEYAIKVR